MGLQTHVPVGSVVVHLLRGATDPINPLGTYCGNMQPYTAATFGRLAEATCPDCIQEYQAQEVEGALVRDDVEGDLDALQDLNDALIPPFIPPLLQGPKALKGR